MKYLKIDIARDDVDAWGKFTMWPGDKAVLGFDLESEAGWKIRPGVDTGRCNGAP